MRKTNAPALAALLDRLGQHSKSDLQELCRRQELPTKGSRDELIARLVEPKPEPKIETWEYQAPPQ